MYYPYYDQSLDRKDPPNQLIQDLEKALNGEYSAIQCYKILFEQVESKEEKDRIEEIRKDEQEHYRQFSHIYLSLTGHQPSPQQIEACAGTYQEGLQAAFLNEQLTTDFYLDVADQATEPYIKSAFLRAAADEQNHAVWFLYYLNS